MRVWTFLILKRTRSFKLWQPLHSQKTFIRYEAVTGDSLTLGVKVSGGGPFKLVYEIVNAAGKRSEYTVKDVEGPDIEITTPPFKFGGRYTIALVYLQDSKGCRSTLNTARSGH